MRGSLIISSGGVKGSEKAGSGRQGPGALMYWSGPAAS